MRAREQQETTKKRQWWRSWTRETKLRNAKSIFATTASAIQTWRNRRRWRLAILPDTRTSPRTTAHACGTAFKLASELEMHIVERHTRKSSKASQRCKICGMYSKGDELVCLFCGRLVDAPIESNLGNFNPNGWRFSFSRSFFSFFFLFFFSLLLCLFLQGDSYWWVAIFSWYVLVRVSPYFSLK